MKNSYVDRRAKAYVDTIKDAKIKDLKITDNIEEAKKYISSSFYGSYWDNNLEFNYDHYYEDWVDKATFK